MKTTGFLKCPLKFILKFSTLILTEKLQSHFFAVTETLNGDKSDSSQCYSEFYWILLNFKNILNSRILVDAKRPGTEFPIYDRRHYITLSAPILPLLSHFEYTPFRVA